MSDERNFYYGPPMRMRPDGTFRYETWRDRWRSALAQAFWPGQVAFVAEIDQERGVITMRQR